MLLKKTIGIIIILLNVAGLGFLIYMGIILAKEKLFSKEPVQKDVSPVTKSVNKTQKKISNDNIIPDEDDLLKDMDLSDLDNLNLDDFD